MTFKTLGIIFFAVYILGYYIIIFIKNLKPKYFHEKKYIIPFVTGTIFLTVFMTVLTFDLIMNTTDFTVALIGLFPWGVTLYTYGYKSLSLLEISNNEGIINKKEFNIKILEKCLNFLYLADIAVIILYFLIRTR